MTPSLPKIYPITDTRLSGLNHLEQVKRFVAGGADIVQLRDKHASGRDLYEAAVAVIAFARPLGVRIIINDRVDIALACGADGVHLGQEDLSVEYARKLMGAEAIIGFSTHSVEQATAAALMPLDYIAIGPVFDTETKENADPVIGLEVVRAVREVIGEIQLVGIGGINSGNHLAVLDAGASSVAIISDLLRDPEKTCDSFKLLNSVE